MFQNRNNLSNAPFSSAPAFWHRLPLQCDFDIRVTSLSSAESHWVAKGPFSKVPIKSILMLSSVIHVRVSVWIWFEVEQGLLQLVKFDPQPTRVPVSQTNNIAEQRKRCQNALIRFSRYISGLVYWRSFSLGKLNFNAKSVYYALVCNWRFCTKCISKEQYYQNIKLDCHCFSSVH